MNDLADFSDQGYQIERELGHNRGGGRVTYLAINIQTQQQVVIKQFQFAKLGSNWSDYDNYDREIQLLKELNHPGIPRYLNTFQTVDGFCMVQEYKDAQPLSVSRSFNPDNIRNIAIAALEVLVYLQNRIPPVIHRDIKPDNILVDAQGTVYLVDFGFARVGEGEVGVSSVVKGTLGFMPPEQIFNRQLTEASDLYGLGMTLICLLTGTKPDRIGDLVDISYRVSFKHLVPKLNMHWVNWLEKMVESRLKDRYPNALAALEAVPKSPVRPPEAQFSQSSLLFAANQIGEPLTHSIVITNPIPETMLEGTWEVVSHPHDPATASYQWISVEPETFVGNQVECHIRVDTRRLIGGKTYDRKLLLRTNTLAKVYSLPVQVKTASTLAQSGLLPYGSLAVLWLFSLGESWLFAWVVLIVGMVIKSVDVAGIGAVAGAAVGLQLAAWLMRSSGWRIGSSTGSLAAVMLGIAVLIKMLPGEIAINNGFAFTFGMAAGGTGGAILGIVLGTVSEKLVERGNPKPFAIAASLLLAFMGASLGIGFTIGLSHPIVIPVLAGTTLLCIALGVRLYLVQAKVIANYYKAKRHLIKP